MTTCSRSTARWPAGCPATEPVTDTGAPAESFSGTALNEAVEVVVDQRGRVVSVHVDGRALARLWPEQLGRAVVRAHTEAMAAAMTDR